MNWLSFSNLQVQNLLSHKCNYMTCVTCQLSGNYMQEQRRLKSGTRIPVTAEGFGFVDERTPMPRPGWMLNFGKKKPLGKKETLLTNNISDQWYIYV